MGLDAQAELARSTRLLVERSASFRYDEVAEADVRQLWLRLAELGLFEMAASPDTEAMHLVVVAEELGRGACPGPLAASVMAAQLLPDGSDERARVLGGTAIAAACAGSAMSRPAYADVIICIDAGTAWACDTGPRTVQRRGQTIALEPSAAGDLRRYRLLGACRGPIANSLIFAAAYATGASLAMLEAAATYARERVQFGRSLSSFQAVAHPLADAATRVRAARELVRLAGASSLARVHVGAAALAAVSAFAAAKVAARQAHQTLGAYGFSAESPLALRSVRLQAAVVGFPGITEARWLMRQQMRPRPGRAASLPGNAALAAVANAGLSRQERAFRSEVRAFAASLKEEGLVGGYFRLSPEQDDRVAAVYKRLAGLGWLSLAWPRALGGLGMDPVHEFILWDEMAEARAARPSIAANIVAWSLIEAGSPALRATLLPDIRSAAISVALGFSEPDAGSNLGAVRTVAQRLGDAWVIEGTKRWTSNAHSADHLFLLARARESDGADLGVSMFMMPLHNSAVRVTPIPTFDGGRLNEVVLDGVAVPDDHLVGRPGEGLTVLAHALARERHIQFPPGRLRRDLREVTDWMAALGRRLPTSLPEALLDRVADIAACQATGIELARMSDTDNARSVAAAAHKLRWSYACQATASLPFELGMPEAADADSPPGFLWRQTMGETVGGGTSEMMRRTVAADLFR